MITVATYTGPQHFSKVVFVWTGHLHSGWPLTFNTVRYNDLLNGVLAYGHDNHEIEKFTWFIPNGVVPRDDVTNLNAADAASEFKTMYGNRVIVWVNPKEAQPIVSEWIQSNFVFNCRDLQLEPFAGETQADFKAWANAQMEKINDPEYHLVIPLHNI